MKTFWSLSKFSDFLRYIFGISSIPRALTSKGWTEYEIKSREKSPFGYELIESLDIIQDIVMYVPRKIEYTIRYFKNWCRGTHVLQTNTKRGHWGDLVTKIPDALMNSVIDFVEIECFHKQKIFNQENKTLKTDAMVGGLNWLQYEIMHSSNVCNKHHPYEYIIAAYWFAKYQYYTFDAFEGVDLNNETIPTNYCLIEKREKEFSDNVTLHCKNIVEYRDYLWT